MDRTAPDAPVITTPASDTVTNAASLTVAGTAPPDAATVRLFDAASLVTTGAPSSGSFALVVTPGEGAHVYTAVAVDAAGNVSPPSSAVTVTVDRTPPAIPLVLAPVGGTILDAADLLAGQVVFSGTADAGALVTIEVDGVVAGTGYAAAGGAWSVAATLLDGGHTARVRAADAAGNGSGLGVAVSFTLDMVRLAEPLAGGVARGVTSFGQSVDGEDGLGDIFPGRANTWVLDANFALVLASATQYGFPEGALDLWVGTVAATSAADLLDEYIAASGTTTPRLREFPSDQAASEVTFLTPLFGSADGLVTAAVDPGTSGLPVLEETRTGLLAGTADSRLFRTITLAPGQTYTVSWMDLLAPDASTLRLEGAGEPPLGPRYQVVLRAPGGDPLGEPLFVTTSAAMTSARTRTATFSTTAGQIPAGAVDLSFELRSGAWGFAAVDAVALSTTGGPVGLVNGGFEDGLAPWLAGGASESRNVRSAPRVIAIDPAGATTLTVTRTFYAPPSSAWARMVDVFRNDAPVPVTHHVVYLSRLGTTSQSPALAAGGKAVVVSDADGFARDFGIVFGSGAAAFDTFAAPGLLFVVHEVVVPARGQAALVHFVVQLGQGATGDEPRARRHRRRVPGDRGRVPHRRGVPARPRAGGPPGREELLAAPARYFGARRPAISRASPTTASSSSSAFIRFTILPSRKSSPTPPWP